MTVNENIGFPSDINIATETRAVSTEKQAMAASVPPSEEEARILTLGPGSVVLDNFGNLDEVLVWLRNSANSAVNTRTRGPVYFRFLADHDARLSVRDRVEHLNYLNWALTTYTYDVEHVEVGDQTLDEKTGDAVHDSVGDPVYDEVWRRKTELVLKLYNKHDWHLETYSRDIAHHADNFVEITYAYISEAIVTPSDIEEGVTENDAAEEAELDEANFGPDLVFEQERDDVKAFHEPHNPVFTAKVYEPDEEHEGEFTQVEKSVIVSEHVRAAVQAGIDNGLGAGVAEAIGVAMKQSSHYFTPDSVTARLEYATRIGRASIYETSVRVADRILRPKAFTTYLLKEGERVPTRRADVSPPQPRRERRPEKRSRTGTPFVACDLCKRQARFSCGGCSKAVYCGQECQELAWTGNHEHACQ